MIFLTSNFLVYLYVAINQISGNKVNNVHELQAEKHEKCKPGLDIQMNKDML